MKVQPSTGKVLVVFGKNFPNGRVSVDRFETVIANHIFQEQVIKSGCKFIELQTLIGSGSIYEASDFVKELSQLTFPDGTRVSESFSYDGYKLWWVYYNELIHYHGVPYTQYKELLCTLRNFKEVHMYDSKHTHLFEQYLKAYGCRLVIVRNHNLWKYKSLPFGILIQLLLTFISILTLSVSRKALLIFTGDKLDYLRDHDFRMTFIYDELSKRDLTFVEFIRSLESWQTVIKHFLKRKRPVIYSEAIVFLGKMCGVFTPKQWKLKKKLEEVSSQWQGCQESHFRLLVATFYARRFHSDVWTIRLMVALIRFIGVRSSFIPATCQRNFHTVLGCKLLAIPTVGILHGVPSPYATSYDFLPLFDGTKLLSVDSYGLWSEWWKEYYIKNSCAYKKEQLYVSGPMRPLLKDLSSAAFHPRSIDDTIRVLIVSEQVAEPQEILPYLQALIEQSDFACTIKFRPYRDEFEEWIKINAPTLLQQKTVRVVKGSIQDAIKNSDVVVGSYSTAVLEAFLQLKVPIFIYTHKWGDYFSMSKSAETQCFFSRNPDVLIKRIRNTDTIPHSILMTLRERYFGDPYKNGSTWVIDMLVKNMRK